MKQIFNKSVTLLSQATDSHYRTVLLDCISAILDSKVSEGDLIETSQLIALLLREPLTDPGQYQVLLQVSKVKPRTLLSPDLVKKVVQESSSDSGKMASQAT